MPLLKAFLYRRLRFLIGICRNFVNDRCLLRASALAYITLLSIVPVFAFMFALLKGLGVQRRLEPVILERVAAGSQETVARVIEYVDKTNVRSLGVLGLTGVILAVISVLGKIEKSFNDIWGVRRGRTLLRRCSDYLSVVIVSPLLLLIALSLTTSLQSREIFRKITEILPFNRNIDTFMELGSYLCAWVGFSFLYLFMPNTKVRFRSALLGGIIAGTLWQVAQWGYVHFQYGAAKYNAIYGAMAQLPLLLIWIYFSWVLVLLGAEIAAAHQNSRRETLAGEGLHYSISFREAVALGVMGTVTKNFAEGGLPLSSAEIAFALDVPARLVSETVFQLCSSGFLTELEREKTVYLPLRDPAGLLVSDVVNAVRTSGKGWKLPGSAQVPPRLRDILEVLAGATARALGDIKLGDLLDRQEGQ